ncbi:MAG: glycosyltransferase [Pelagibacterales bacterium]|nr:glycosyltransferase [Pelagibacterales bacterium]
MKISILLPLKENFSPIYPGAVSLFINDTLKVSKYRRNTIVYGNTDLNKTFKLKYKNISITKNIFKSQNKSYVEQFLKIEKKRNSDLIEIHNRPSYLNSIYLQTSAKIVLYFHNDPLQMSGSKSTSDRINLFNKTEKIIFNSEWSKKRFLINMKKIFFKSNKLIVIYQSTSKVKLNFSKKQKLITFVGKLNRAKGYDIFGSAIVKILNKYPDWKSNVYGDEPREKIVFKHKNLNLLGFKSHQKVLDNFKKTSITVVCSRWDEPFGRTSLEASSRGCAVIISNRGGLPETVTNSIILKKLNSKFLFTAMDKLIKNKSERKKLQLKNFKNFYLTNEYISKKIDNYRKSIFNFNLKKTSINKKNKFKILHITNFNERHNGRLFYNTGRRLNNGFVRLNHSVLTLSDRDILSYYRSIRDIDGSKTLNKKLIEIISNYVPDLIVLGHADLIERETLAFIKKTYPDIKIAQWFLDRMDDEWKNNKNRFLDKINFVDSSFCTTSPDILNFPKKNKVYFIPNPADESFENLSVYKKKHLKNDVFFAMSHGVHRGNLKKGKFDVREKFIEKLMKKTPNIKYDLYGLKKIQPIWADNFKEAISNSKMGLNLSQGKSIKYYSSDRITQLIGNGLLTFVDKKTKLNKFFKSDEVVFYNSLNELSKKIIKFSIDDKLRKKIAKKGQTKYLKYFNSKIVADFIINKTFDINNKNKYLWHDK